MTPDITPLCDLFAGWSDNALAAGTIIGLALWLSIPALVRGGAVVLRAIWKLRK